MKIAMILMLLLPIVLCVNVLDIELSTDQVSKAREILNALQPWEK